MAVYRVPIEIGFAGAGAPGVNVWHIRPTGVGFPDDAEVQSLVDIIHQFYLSIAGIFHNSVDLDLGTVVNVATGETRTPTFAHMDGQAADTLQAPQALAIVVSWYTSIAARRGRGRTFLGPLARSQIEGDGTIIPGTLTTVRDAASALVAASAASGNGAVGVWGLENPAPPGTEDYSALPHVLRDVTGYKVRDLFGVLRSRRD